MQTWMRRQRNLGAAPIVGSISWQRRLDSVPLSIRGLFRKSKGSYWFRAPLLSFASRNLQEPHDEQATVAEKGSLLRRRSLEWDHAHGGGGWGGQRERRGAAMAYSIVAKMTLKVRQTCAR